MCQQVGVLEGKIGTPSPPSGTSGAFSLLGSIMNKTTNRQKHFGLESFTENLINIHKILDFPLVRENTSS